MLSCLDKIRLNLDRRHARINDHFTDFDRLRSGAITKEQFARCIKMSNLFDLLSEQEIAELMRSYEVRENSDLVNYIEFLKDIERENPPRTYLSPDRGVVHTLEREREALLSRMYKFFHQKVTAIGLDLRSLFKDFDKHNTFRVTPSQFERCFPFQIDPMIMRAIKEKYADEKGDIAYNCWIADVLNDPVNKPPVVLKGLPPRPEDFGGGLKSHEVRDLVLEIRNQIATNKVRLEDFLRDYDRLNSGIVTESQFAAALGRVRFVRYQISASDIAKLSQHYAAVDSSGAKVVNYARFLREVMPHDPKDGVEPTPTSQSYGVPMGEVERTRLGVILNRIRTAVSSHRINLRPTFHHFDRATKGIYRTLTCTRNRFDRTLAINGIRLTPEEADILAKHYAVTSIDGENGDINYQAFCDDVEKPQVVIDADAVASIPAPSSITGGSLYKSSASNGGGFNTSSSSSSSSSAAKSMAQQSRFNTSTYGIGTKSVPGLPSQTAIADEDMSLDGILNRMMRVAIDRGVRLGEFIRDGDPLRSGKITKEKFLSAILSSKVPMRQEEMDVLVEHYASPSLPGYVDINRFLDDVDTGVEIAHPAVEPVDWEREVKRGVKGSHELRKEQAITAPVRDQLLIILRRISEDVTARGILLPPFFQDYDRHKLGKCTKVQFHQTISRHRLPVSEDEVEVLKAYYEDPYDPDCVRFRQFIGDVDSSENVNFQLSERTGVRRYAAASTLGSPGAKTSSIYFPNQSYNGSLVTREVEGAQSCVITDPVALSAVQKVADFVLRRNVRLGEFFKDADPLKQGFVTPHRFRHALVILGIDSLTDAEFAALEKAFDSPKENGAVAYLEFLNAVTQTPPKPQLSSVTGERMTERDNVEDMLLEGIIQKCRRGFSTRRVHSRQCFQEYDKLHKGRVLEGYFFTALMSVGLCLTPKENEMLRKAYRAGDGYMYYGEFASKVDENLQLS